jgi:transcriptional regulator GlxA family with amidase domain
VLAADVLGPGADRLKSDVLAVVDDTDRAAAADAFLVERMPQHDRHYEELLAVIAVMLADRRLVSVEALSRATGTSPRTLQRLFRRYVGIGPKWVLQRFRLQDAVARIDAGDVADLSTLAVELGWYDQAHFSRDFTDVVGVSPGLYLRRSRQPRPAPRGA